MLEHLLDFFIPAAWAQALPPQQPGGGISFVVMFVVFFLFIYFAIWRPQNKRAKEQQLMLNALNNGDEVVIAGGILGKITKLSDRYISLNLADNVNILVQKSSIMSVLPKGTIKSIE